MVSVFDQKDLGHAIACAGRLRADGLRVLVYPDADKIGKQIKYADSRGIPFVALLGSNEVAAGTVTVKDPQGPDAADVRSDGRRQRPVREALNDRG
jgi:histidyl-tRNA synthetase